MNDIATTTEPQRGDRPLAISMLLGVSGWFAGLFMLVFVGLLFKPDSPGQAALCGAVLLVAAWGLFKANQRAEEAGDGLFIAQLALALSIAGQCLLIYALSDRARGGPSGIVHATLALQIVLAAAMPNRLHRTLSTLFATIAWALTVRYALAGEPDHLWSAEARAAASPSSALAIAGWLATWAPIAAALAWLIRRDAVAAGDSAPGRAARDAILIGLILGLAFATIASQPLESWHGWFGAEADMGRLALWPLASALGALGAAAAAFARRRRGLVALCVAAALLHLSHFYYALGTSLVAKSVLMAAMGALALLAARAIRTKEPA